MKLTIAIAVAVATLGAAPAAAHALDCGAQLRESVKLTEDLTGCPENGLVITADGVTVDLNGHTLRGSGAGGFDGVVIDGNHSRVTVKNGRIADFGGAVLLPGGAVATDVVVRNVTSTDGVFAAGVSGLRLMNDTFGKRLLLFEAEHTVIDGNTIHGQVSFFFTANDNRVTHNTIQGSDGRGVLIFGGFAPARDNRIAHNTIDGTVSEGIQLAGDVSGTVVEHNTISHSEENGINVNSEINEDTGGTLVPTGNVIAHNRIGASFGGIDAIEADGNRFTRNTIVGVGTFGDPNGPFGRGGHGILIAGGSDNVVSGNSVSGGRGGLPGIRVGGDGVRPVSGNAIERNDVDGNEADGIAIDAVARDTVLDRNTADGNGHDGIHVLSPFTTLARNRAVGNAAYGIEAVTGVNDGGHNRAAGNGAAAQCAGVVCR